MYVRNSLHCFLFTLEILSNDDVASCEEVCNWVRKLGKKYAVYADIFKEHRVDGYWLLNYTNDEELQKYGITDEDHRRFILDEIKKLKKKSKVTFVPNEKATN